MIHSQCPAKGSFYPTWDRNGEFGLERGSMGQARWAVDSGLPAHFNDPPKDKPRRKTA
jgi:hypothetical protein